MSRSGTAVPLINGLAGQPQIALQTLLSNPQGFVQSSKRTLEDEKNEPFAPIRSTTNEHMSNKRVAIDGGRNGQTAKPSTPPHQRSQNHQMTKSVIHWPRHVSNLPRSKGLPNRSNTCYRNSVIQAVLHLPILLFCLEAHNDCSIDECTICALRQLYLSYWDIKQQSKHTIIRVAQLERNLRGNKNAFQGQGWQWSEQQDAGEFYIHMMSSIAQQNDRGDDPLQTLMGVRTETHIKCGACNYVSSPEQVRDYRLGVSPKNQDPLVQLLRDQHSGVERVPWRCTKCEVRREKNVLRRRVAVWPDILVIDINRHAATQPGRNKDRAYRKQLMYVSFESELDVSQFPDAQPDTRYHLFAVVQHQGSHKHGHYRCIARSPKGGWEKFDDEIVTPVEGTAAWVHENNWTPYILFYQRIRSSKSS